MSYFKSRARQRGRAPLVELLLSLLTGLVEHSRVHGTMRKGQRSDVGPVTRILTGSALSARTQLTAKA
jgi:hypothetical protein